MYESRPVPTGVITVRRAQVDMCCYGTTHTRYQQRGPPGYKTVVVRSLWCRKFQETADMLRFLVLTSLAALGKNSLILPLVRLFAHKCDSYLMPDSALHSAGRAGAPAQVPGG